MPKGDATTLKGVPTDQAGYPNKYSYDKTTKLISVGAGRFGPVAPEIWEFEVSGLKVVQSWLGYRMKDRKGKKSSPLDDIRPESWTAGMGDEFLELLWVLEATLDMEPELEKLLDKVWQDHVSPQTNCRRRQKKSACRQSLMPGRAPYCKMKKKMVLPA